MNNKGQSVMAEHVMVFFIVIAALVAMTTFVQRSFEARIHDARNYIITSVNSVCDANCQMATGQVSYEYEPYYMQMLADTQHNSAEVQGTSQGSAESIGAIYNKAVNEQTTTISSSNQLPPECGGANPPSYCTGL